MTIFLNNSLTRQKEEFKPLKPDTVSMYVCGPTVYDQPHIGNARAVVVYDILYRLLKSLYKEVKYVRNITDVDDKIIKAAKENGESIANLTDRITKGFHEDMKALNCLPPTEEPKATTHIPDMIKMIEKLITNGHAYVADGHVLFSVKSLQTPPPNRPLNSSPLAGEVRRGDGDSTPPSRGSNIPVQSPWYYGQLSGKKLDDLIAGARVEVEGYKKDPGDFILWKPADSDDDASSVFDSPWGKGRPGWHIECSAMSTKYLGETFDIHGGGADLKFPHHENEIAQSICANPESHFARYWIHNGFLTVNGEKMAKSAGNFITVRELLDKGIKGEVIRYVLLATKYNEPLDWSEKRLEDAKKNLDRAYNKFATIPVNSKPTIEHLKPLCDDLNTPEFFAAINYIEDEYMVGCMKFLGFLKQDPEEWFRGGTDASGIEAKIAARNEAKKARNFAEADKIRDELKAQGIILEDNKDGTTWRKA